MAPARSPRFLAALALIALGALALRFAGLDGQSFGRDEAATVLDVRHGLGGVFDRVFAREAQPPGYFVLAWLWSQPFGVGEVGLRSLSVLAGTATVGVAGLIGARWSQTAGLLAAAVTATNPFLVWYSQEARTYALLGLLAALAVLFALTDRPRAWSVTAALALLCHYFVVFLLVPLALLLVWRRGRAALGALALPVVVGAALVPLVVAQNDGRIVESGQAQVASRLSAIVKSWTVGLYGTPVDALGVLAAVLVALGAALALRRRRIDVLALAAAAFVLSVLPRVVGQDFVGDRSEFAVLVPILVTAAAGFADGAARWLGAAAVALGLFFCVDIATSPALQREDWRAVAASLGPETAVVVSPDAEQLMPVYVRGIGPATPAPVRAVVFAASWRAGRPRTPTPTPPPGFAFAGRTDTPTTTVVRFTAPAPQPIAEQSLIAQWRPSPGASQVFFTP